MLFDYPLLINFSFQAALGVFFYEKDEGNADSLGWLPLVSLIIFVTAFSFGLGPMPWLMMGK